MTTTEAKTEAVVATSDEPSSEKPAGVDQDLIGQLVAQAREQGLDLAGEGGLLAQLTKQVLEARSIPGQGLASIGGCGYRPIDGLER
jgi:hypothetical protein